MVLQASDFIVTPEEVIGLAIEHAGMLIDEDWDLEVEPWDVEYPGTPTLRGRRSNGRGVAFVEVGSKIDPATTRDWIGYGKSLGEPCHFWKVVPESVTVSAGEIVLLRELGAGLYAGPQAVLLPAHDLSIDIHLPTVSGSLRKRLRRAYKLFSEGNWIEGFETACTCLEQESRKYLATRMQNSGFTFVNDKGVPKVVNIATVEKGTMGSLAKLYAGIAAPNQDDSKIAEALSRLNDNRITAAHYKDNDPVREERLARDVSRQMFVVVGGLSSAMKLP